MKKNLLVYSILIALQIGLVTAQERYSYAKARFGKKHASLPIKSVRVYNAVEGQILFLRAYHHTRTEQELWEIFDEPGGMIHFFPADSMRYASISLGQDQAYVSQLLDEQSNPTFWQLTSSSDTVYVQSIPNQRGIKDETIRYRLFKRFRTHHGIQSLDQFIEVDLLHLLYHPDERKVIRFESQDSLRDYPKLFTIMALMIVLRQHIGT